MKIKPLPVQSGSGFILSKQHGERARTAVSGFAYSLDVVREISEIVGGLKNRKKGGG